MLLVGAPRVVTAALDRLATALPEGATLGAAEPVADLHATAEGFAEARHVAEVAAASPHRTPGRVHRTADLGVRGLLWRLRGDARLTAFAEAQLAPLFETPDDLALLTDHLQVNGSMTRLAERLHLSRPPPTAGSTGSRGAWAATWRTPRCGSGSTSRCSACRDRHARPGEEFPGGDPRVHLGPRRHVDRTTPVSVRPAYGETGLRCCSAAGSTTHSASGANTEKSATHPAARRPRSVSPTRSAVAVAIHPTTVGRGTPRSRAAVQTTGNPSWTDAIPPHAAPKSPSSSRLSSAVHGEWSETTQSTVPSSSPRHRASCSARSRIGGQHLNVVSPSGTSSAASAR